MLHVEPIHLEAKIGHPSLVSVNATFDGGCAGIEQALEQEREYPSVRTTIEGCDVRDPDGGATPMQVCPSNEIYSPRRCASGVLQID